MCKCLQYCLESCYWHLIEKRFCYDESIALYEVPEKEEKNNNFFDNLAFYDSVAVIAGRSVVTIDPLPEEKPIMQQPTRKLRFEESDKIEDDNQTSCVISDENKKENEKGAEDVKQEEAQKEDKKEEEKKENEEQKEESKEDDNNEKTNENPSSSNTVDASKPETLKPENVEDVVEHRRKSLKDRRLSKSLYLKIDLPKEIPIIRQQSMPKFYLDTPDDQSTTSMFRTPSAALSSPVPKSPNFVYDLYSVVQMARVQNTENQVPVHRKELDRASRLLQIRDKIKLRRVKSSLGTTVTNLPHSHQHM